MLATAAAPDMIAAAPTTPDLWPGEVSFVEPIRSPASILREQASFLNRHTRNIVKGLVRPESRISSHRVRYAFLLDAPVLRYSYALFSISHSLNFYPLRVHLPRSLAPQEQDTLLRSENIYLLSPVSSETTEIETKNETGLIETLKTIFSSPETQYIIRSLYTQSLDAGESQFSENETEEENGFAWEQEEPASLSPS